MRFRPNGGSTPVALKTGLMAFVLLGLAIPVQAQTKQKRSYDVQVLAIRATKSHKEVSPELKPIAKELAKRFGFTGFKQEKKVEGKVEEGKQLSGALVSGYSIKITPLEPDKKGYVKMKVEITKKEKGKDKPEMTTTVSTKRGRFWLQGVPYGDGSDDYLIIAVSAR